VGQMDEITQQNAALVEQAAAASESMQAQAGKLSELVGAFRMTQSGDGQMSAVQCPARQAGSGLLRKSLAAT